MWGGFFTANSSKGSDKDAQLIGAEIDVNNDTKPGIAPNASKTGLQVVGIGSVSVTNAIEIIGFDRGLWTNGLSFADHFYQPEWYLYWIRANYAWTYRYQHVKHTF